ncbi:MAG TPA: MFS transporter [Candidatus Ligilactobacillus excrementavium]|nr:MFS transporter [Candidatus Ligilactobacillus excrementavium]
MKNKNYETGWVERISYGLSDAADNLIFQMMSSYLLFFYTDVYGLRARDVGILFAIARFLDVVESVILGLMIDRTHSKWGKSRPFFLWYALPYVLVAILTFVTPDFSGGGKLAWAYVTYLGLGFLYTAVNLPVTSILPTMTENDREITILGVIRQFFGSLVQVVVATFTIPLVKLIGQGDQQKGFLGTVIIFGIISLVLILNTFVQVRERHTNQEMSHQPLSKVWNMLRHNQPWIVLSIVVFLYWLSTAIKNQTTIYYFKYVYENDNLVSVANSFTLASIIGVLLILRFTQVRSKKATMSHGILIELLGQIIIGVGAYTKTLWITFAGIFVNSIGNGIVIGLVSIMIADTISYGTTMGIQAEGLLASTSDWGVNLGLGIGGLITASMFDASGYVANQAQNAATLHMIDLNFVWIPMVIYVLMYLILRKYDESVMQPQE